MMDLQLRDNPCSAAVSGCVPPSRTESSRSRTVTATTQDAARDGCATWVARLETVYEGRDGCSTLTAGLPEPLPQSQRPNQSAQPCSTQIPPEHRASRNPRPFVLGRPASPS